MEIEMLGYEEAVARHEALSKASALYRSDIRFRALVESSAHEAIKRYGPINPGKVDEGVLDIAVEACTFLLAQVYLGDAEIRALKRERDAYKAHCSKLLTMGLALPPVILKPA